MKMQGRKTLMSGSKHGEASFPFNYLKQPPMPLVAAFLLLFDSLLTFAIVFYVPYTKIDWDAYISQVTGFLAGERNYTNLRGDTGPLVYPAGFLYAYSSIYHLIGAAIFPAQVIFAVLYLINIGLVLSIYIKANAIPWWALLFLCLSKRIHSIFVLRLFNDCIATTLAHLSILFFQANKWNLGMLVFSVAVSVKMNVLLYAPPLLLLMLKAMPFRGVIESLSLAAFVQIFMGLPFLLAYPMEYLSRAFDLGRVFVHHWSVNFKFVPEEIFISKLFSILLLALHLSLLFLYANFKWCRHEGGILSSLRFVALFRQGQSHGICKLIHSIFSCSSKSQRRLLKPEHITMLLFSGNFIGIFCARSLHYQFYSWYFFSLPFLLWRTPFPTVIRLFLLGAIEICWNVFPSNAISSLSLLAFHSIIMWGLWLAPSESPYADDDDEPCNKTKSARKKVQ